MRITTFNTEESEEEKKELASDDEVYDRLLDKTL